MSGPSKSDKSLVRQTSQNQINVGSEMVDLARTQMQRQQEFENPIAKLMKLISGGDREAATQAVAAPIGEVTRAAQASKEAAYDQPAGAGRDYALATVAAGKNSQVAGLLNQTWMDAFAKLAGLGTEAGQTGLQLFGGGFRGMEGGTQGIGQVMQADAAGRAAMFSLLGSLAGAGGKIAGGILAKPAALNPTQITSSLFAAPIGSGY